MFIVVAALVVVFGIDILKQEETPVGEENSPPVGISDEEKNLIDAWIQENDLNQYGDFKGMVYAGGTPLFNEKTGESIDRYEYILQRYPDRPWGR